MSSGVEMEDATDDEVCEEAYMVPLDEAVLLDERRTLRRASRDEVRLRLCCSVQPALEGCRVGAKVGSCALLGGTRG